MQKKDNFPVLKYHDPENSRKFQKSSQAVPEEEIYLYAFFKDLILQIYLKRFPSQIFY